MILFSYAFRPFFLVASVFGVIAIGLWTASLVNADLGRYLALDLFWHTHEMIFGFVAAAIAGFLLTASPVWTGGPALAGVPLAALVSLWVAGRVCFAAASFLPAWFVASVDVAFLPSVGLVVWRTQLHR